MRILLVAFVATFLALPGRGLAATGRRIMINIPARRLRLYRGQELELDVPCAIGRRHYPGEKGNTRTRIGSYRITSWHHDYHSRDYPVPWSRDPWRGAFGRWAAKLGPRASYQYIHGTAGPAWLGDWLVEKLPPRAGDPAASRELPTGEHGLSHGCTRLSNDNIEKLRTLCPVGTPVEKVYCLTELHPDGEGGRREVTHPNVYHYRLQPGGPLLYVDTGRLVGYSHPPGAVGPR